MNTHIHICDTCGDAKEIYILPEEKPEDLSGCVCSREVKKIGRHDEASLLRMLSRDAHRKERRQQII